MIFERVLAYGMLAIGTVLILGVWYATS